MDINFRVEYDPAPIRHVAVQCPYCNKWFSGYDILAESKLLRFESDLEFANFICPICDREFSGYNPDSGFEIIKIQECDNHMEVYKDCLKKKVKWE